MACIRRCTGTALCDSLSIGCIQFPQDGGKECDGVPNGASTIQFDINGNLVICSNVGGICTCETVASGPTGTDVVINNNDGTFTHTSIDGTPVTIDICDLLSDAWDESPWVAMVLSAGWVAEPGQQAPQYRCLCDGTIQFRGCIFHDDADDDNAVPEAIGTLAANDGAGHSCRPGAAVRFQGGANCATIEIASDGTITTNPSITPPTRCFNGLEFYI